MRSTRALVFLVLGNAALWGCSPAGGGDGPAATGGRGAGSGGSGGNSSGSGGNSTSTGRGGGPSTATGGTPGSGGQSSGTGGTGVVGSGGTSGGATGGSAGGSGSSGTGGGSSGTGGRTGSGGAIGTGGGAQTGGAGGAGTPPLAGLGSCALPTGAAFADVQAAYAKWKTDLLTSEGAGGFLRVRRPNSGEPLNTTNSEGISYGMTAAVYMDDQPVFDQLWKYEQLHLNARGLMNWEVNPEGTGPTQNGTGAATDGDEDMAFALLMADKKWGGSGSLSDTYLNYAKRQINLIWQHEVDHTRGDVLAPGDQFGGGAVINISYFAPAYYRAFGRATGQVANWNRVVESTYTVIAATLNAANGNANNGLVPAWSTPAGVPQRPPNSNHPIHHQLDSCRTPFRLAQDYCWNNEPRALAYLQKINAFHAGLGARNIVDGYNLDGTVFEGANLNLAAFVGPAGVGAMATALHAPFRAQAYSALVTPPGLLGGSLYYNHSWSVLSLIMMTGRFVDLTK